MQVRFGPFVLDSESRELLRDSHRVPLSPKAFDLLSILVASRPKAISKGELQERLWPATFVVEKNLANLVSEIRDAIGDDPSDPRFIRTVPRFGYAFRETVHRTDTGRPEGRSEVSFRITWIAGRVTLDEGEHVIGRDPNVEIYLDAPGSLGATHRSRSRPPARRSKTWEARMGRLSGISESTDPERLAMATSSPSAP